MAADSPASTSSSSAAFSPATAVVAAMRMARTKALVVNGSGEAKSRASTIWGRVGVVMERGGLDLQSGSFHHVIIIFSLGDSVGGEFTFPQFPQGGIGFGAGNFIAIDDDFPQQVVLSDAQVPQLH